MCGGVAPQLVSDESPRFAALAFQKLAEELLRRTPIASGLNEDVYEVAGGSATASSQVRTISAIRLSRSSTSVSMRFAYGSRKMR